MIEAMRSAAEHDYLTLPEAADYACMPIGDFLPAARRCGVVCYHLYRKADIQAAMDETQWAPVLKA
jgi:hypothetical protein